MSADISRAELEAMDKDELVETVLGLKQTVDVLSESLWDADDTLHGDWTPCKARDVLPEDSVVDTLEAMEGRLDDLEAENERLRERLDEQADDPVDEGTLRDVEGRVHREQTKLARRLSALEDEVGVDGVDALAVSEGGEDARELTPLGRLVRNGPEALESKKGTATLKRARELYERWDKWGKSSRIDATTKERRLASNRDDLKTRLEDVRAESLDWQQVYRAMRVVADLSGGRIEYKEDGRQGEGKVLVHRIEEDSTR